MIKKIVKRIINTITGRQSLLVEIERLKLSNKLLKDSNRDLNELKDDYKASLDLYKNMDTLKRLEFVAASVVENLESDGTANHVIRIIDANTIEIRKISIDSNECWSVGDVVRKISIS